MFNDAFENPSYDDHGLETTENHIIESASNISTLQSNNHFPASSNSPPPAPEWTDPDLIVNNTSMNVDDCHTFDQTIAPMTWAYQRDAEENLYIQHGFSPLNAEAPSADGDLDWKIVRKVLGLVKNSTPRSYHPAIQAFVTNMINRSGDADAVRTIVDLDISTNTAFPLQKLSHNLFVVDANTFRGEVYYFITVKNSQTLQPCWQLATNYAPAVLQCFREDLGGSVQNAAHFLLSNGIPFNTFSCHVDLSPRAKNTRTYMPHSLGWRPTGHRPGPREYTVYEELRDRVLNRPYRHAALLQGGIVWCLALHALEFPTDAEISVTQGPLEDALTRGTIIGLDDGVELFDDTLTEEEIELICGVYKWSTGMCDV